MQFTQPDPILANILLVVFRLLFFTSFCDICMPLISSDCNLMMVAIEGRNMQFTQPDPILANIPLVVFRLLFFTSFCDICITQWGCLTSNLFSYNVTSVRVSIIGTVSPIAFFGGYVYYADYLSFSKEIKAQITQYTKHNPSTYPFYLFTVQKRSFNPVLDEQLYLRRYTPSAASHHSNHASGDECWIPC